MDADYGLQARVPADIDAPDRVLYSLTARQVAILAATGALLWAAYHVLTPLVPPAVVGIAAVPVAAVAAGLALGRRDGISMDRWVAAALATARAPRLLVAAGQQVAPLPAWAAPMRTAETTNTRRSTRAGSRSDTRGGAARRRAGDAARATPRGRRRAGAAAGAAAAARRPHQCWRGGRPRWARQRQAGPGGADRGVHGQLRPAQFR